MHCFYLVCPVSTFVTCSQMMAAEEPRSPGVEEKERCFQFRALSLISEGLPSGLT